MAFKLTRIGVFITAAYLLGLLLFLQRDSMVIAGAILLSTALNCDRLLQKSLHPRVFALMSVGYVAGLLLMLMDLEYPNVVARGPVLLAGCLLCDVIGRRLEEDARSDHKVHTRLNRFEPEQSDDS